MGSIVIGATREGGDVDDDGDFIVLTLTEREESGVCNEDGAI